MPSILSSFLHMMSICLSFSSVVDSVIKPKTSSANLYPSLKVEGISGTALPPSPKRFLAVCFRACTSRDSKCLRVPYLMGSSVIFAKGKLPNPQSCRQWKPFGHHKGFHLAQEWQDLSQQMPLCVLGCNLSCACMFLSTTSLAPYGTF